MKEKLLIIGAGGFGRSLSELARENYECFFLDDNADKNQIICQTKVIGKIKDINVLYPEFTNLIVAIGNNSLREKIYLEAKTIGYHFPNILGRNVYISPFSTVGEGCVFHNNVTIQNGAHVGNGVILNPNVEIHIDGSVDDYSLIYSNSVIRTYAKVAKRVRIGSNVTISNNAIVDCDSDIKDGSVISKERSM